MNKARASDRMEADRSNSMQRSATDDGNKPVYLNENNDNRASGTVASEELMLIKMMAELSLPKCHQLQATNIRASRNSISDPNLALPASSTFRLTMEPPPSLRIDHRGNMFTMASCRLRNNPAARRLSLDERSTAKKIVSVPGESQAQQADWRALDKLMKDFNLRPPEGSQTRADDQRKSAEPESTVSHMGRVDRCQETSENHARNEGRGLDHYAAGIGQNNMILQNCVHMHREDVLGNLLYNIICYLLIQDDQTLSKSSVSKLIDAIRAHLESTSKIYSAAILSVGPRTSDHSQGQMVPGAGSKHDGRKESLGSLSYTSSSASCDLCSINPGHPVNGVCFASDAGHKIEPEITMNRKDSGSCREQSSSDFRRLSSTCFENRGLIDELCSQQETICDSKGCDSPVSICQESPWRFEELSCRRKYSSSNQFSCRASDDSPQPTLYDLMNDSGIGTSYNFAVGGSKVGAANRNRSSHNEANMSKTSSLSSMAECSSQLGGASMQAITSYDDSSPILKKADRNKAIEVDVASRRAELEWTLNKLINFELKYTWLTNKRTLRKTIRKSGVPNEIRAKVWLILIEKLVDCKYNVSIVNEIDAQILTVMMVNSKIRPRICSKVPTKQSRTRRRAKVLPTKRFSQ